MPSRSAAEARVGMSGWVYALARRVLPEGLRQADELAYASEPRDLDRAQRLVLLAAEPRAGQKWRADDPGRLRVLGQGSALHHPHAAGCEDVDRAAGELLRLRNPRARCPSSVRSSGSSRPTSTSTPSCSSGSSLLPRTTTEAVELAGNRRPGWTASEYLTRMPTAHRGTRSSPATSASTTRMPQRSWTKHGVADRARRQRGSMARSSTGSQQISPTRACTATGVVHDGYDDEPAWNLGGVGATHLDDGRDTYVYFDTTRRSGCLSTP